MKRTFAAVAAFIALLLSGASVAKTHLTPVAGSTPQTTAPGTVFPHPLGVLVTDAATGAPQAGVQVLFSIGAYGPTGFFPGGAVQAFATTDASGVATSPPITANMQVGTFDVSLGVPPPQLLPDNDISFQLTIYEPPSPPGQKIWTGRGATPNWSEGINWVGGLPPVNGDMLVFPDGALRNASIPDVSGQFSSLYITAGAGHVFNGGGIDLTADTPIRIESATALVVFNCVVQIHSHNATIVTRNPAPTPFTAMPQIMVGPTGALRPTGGTLLFDTPIGRVQIDGALQDYFSTSMTFAGNDFFLDGPLSYALPLQVNGGSGGVFEIVPPGSAHGASNVVVNSGRLILGTSFSPPVAASAIDLRAPFDVNANLVMLASDTSTAAATIDGISISGPQMVEFGTVAGSISHVTGNGQLWLWGTTDDHQINLGNTGNTFTGGLLVYRGWVRIAGPEAIPDTGSLQVAAYAKLTLENRLETVASFICAHPGTLDIFLDTTIKVTTGPISVDGCNLTLETPYAFVPPASGAITLIRNLGGAAVEGAFQGLPEGAAVTAGGMTMHITYRGGSGHDVVLLTPAPPPVVASLQIVSGNLQSIARGGTAAPFAVRALDAAGKPLAGATVQFHMTAACGTFAGGGSDAAATTDSTGLATAPAFIAGNVSAQCANVAAVAGSSASATLVASVYAPSNVTLTPSPPAIACTVGQAYALSVTVADGAVPLPGIAVTFEAVASGPATAAGLSASASTDVLGRAAASAVANSFNGDYTIVAHWAGRSVAIPVTQSGATPPVPAATAPAVQDMGWAGLAENGWGVSVVQHVDKLFAVVYAYDSDGKPTWFVMPAGTWDATSPSYWGNLYHPAGAPFFSYDASHFAAGTAVGSVAFSFDDADHARLAYTINGVSGVKSISRQPFGAVGGSAVQGRGDMWWGGPSQNGWGIAVLQQYATLFSVWFTYDANGAPTWYVMPGGTWADADTYSGRIYRTTGSPWVGHAYDPGQLQVTDVGPFRLHFSGDTATFDYTVEGRSGTLSLSRQGF